MHSISWALRRPMYLVVKAFCGYLPMKRCEGHVAHLLPTCQVCRASREAFPLESDPLLGKKLREALKCRRRFEPVPCLQPCCGGLDEPLFACRPSGMAKRKLRDSFEAATRFTDCVVGSASNHALHALQQRTLLRMLHARWWQDQLDFARSTCVRARAHEPPDDDIPRVHIISRGVYSSAGGHLQHM